MFAGHLALDRHDRERRGQVEEDDPNQLEHIARAADVDGVRTMCCNLHSGVDREGDYREGHRQDPQGRERGEALVVGDQSHPD